MQQEEERALRTNLKNLSNRMSRHLAFITAYHHRDVEMYRRWRGIVYICNQPLSESPGGDAASFARCMWERYLGKHQVPIKPDLWQNIDFAYSCFMHTTEEMMDCILARFSNERNFGRRQEQKQLEDDLMAVRNRLQEILWKHCAKRSFQGDYCYSETLDYDFFSSGAADAAMPRYCCRVR